MAVLGEMLGDEILDGSCIYDIERYRLHFGSFMGMASPLSSPR